MATGMATFSPSSVVVRSRFEVSTRTRCRNLTEARTCSVYQTRPLVCSEFSSDDCERNSGESAWKHYFHTHEDLLAFMRTKRPAAFARYMKKRRMLAKKRSAR